MAPLQPKGGHFGLILPLCTSSATLGLALFQYPLFYSMLSTHPDSAGKQLSAFWANWIRPARPFLGSVAATSLVGGVLSARWLHTHSTLETTDVSKFYAYGAVLSAVHLAFVPLVAGPIKAMAERAEGVETEVAEKNKDDMKYWYLLHTLRTLIVDVPALWCFAEGAALSFWVI